MTIEEALVFCKNKTSYINSRTLVSKATGFKDEELVSHYNEQLKEEQIDILKNDLKLVIENKKPIQYITNSVNFCGLELYVDERVLIPRFETEELVENTIKYLETFDKPKILDLCCGSGAIGLALKNRLPNSIVSMSDISKDALEVANQNKKVLNLDVNIIESDLFNNIEEKYDCIVSNPPYIKTNEEIDLLVKKHEPNIALYGGENGLDYYEAILKNINKHLNEKFIIAFEIGKDQKEDIISIINSYLNNVEIIALKDLSNNDRMIFVKSKNV